MALTPLDIHHKEFRTARFGGYNEEEVDTFLDLVADEFERLIQETDEVKKQMEQMRARLSEFEQMQNSLQNALLAATKSAEMLKEEARQETEAMISKAQEEAESLVRSAQEEARQMNLRAHNERQKLERSFTRLKELKRDYIKSIRGMAEAHLAEVAEIEAAEAEHAPKVASDEAGLDADEQSEKPVMADEAPPASPTYVPPAPVETRDAPASFAEAPAVVPPLPDEGPSETGQTSPPVAASGPEPEPSVVPEGRRDATDDSGHGADPRVYEPPRAASSNLVDEVLAIDARDEDIYSGMEDGDSEEDRGKGRRGRKEKGEKHFFWE